MRADVATRSRALAHVSPSLIIIEASAVQIKIDRVTEGKIPAELTCDSTACGDPRPRHICCA